MKRPKATFFLAWNDRYEGHIRQATYEKLLPILHPSERLEAIFWNTFSRNFGKLKSKWVFTLNLLRLQFQLLTKSERVFSGFLLNINLEFFNKFYLAQTDNMLAKWRQKCHYPAVWARIQLFWFPNGGKTPNS